MVLSETIRKQLLASFRVELKEHLQTMNDGLLALEQQSVSGEARQELLNQVFRAAHSLKGAARTVDATMVMELAHALEDVLALLRRDAIEPSQELFTTCYQTLDAIQIVQATHESGDAPPAGADRILAALAPFRTAQTPDMASKPEVEQAPAPTDQVSSEEPGPPTDAPQTPEPKQHQGKRPVNASAPALKDETIRVQTSKLDALMAQLSELLLTKIRVEQRLTQLRDIEQRMGAWQDDWLTVRSTYARLSRRHTSRDGGDGPAIFPGREPPAPKSTRPESVGVGLGRAATTTNVLSNARISDKDLSLYFPVSEIGKRIENGLNSW